jgi:hypothetical protein
MGTVNLFRGLNSRREIYNFSGPVRDNFDLDWNNAKIFKELEEVSPDYFVQEDDVLSIQEYPGTGVEVALVIGIVSLVTGLAAGVYSIIAADRAQREMNEALERLNNRNNAKKEVSSIPGLSGGRNEPASGKQAPIILGRHLFAPYFLSDPYMRPEGTDGEDFYFYASMLAGQNGLHIEKLRNGQADLIAFPADQVIQKGKYNFNAAGGAFGEPGNYAIVIQDNYELPQEYGVFEEKWADSLDSTVEIGRKKKDNAQVVDDLYMDDDGPVPIIRESARFPMRVEAEVMVDGLFGWDSKNSVPTNATLHISIGWSTNKDGPWNFARIGNWEYSGAASSLTKNSMRQLRYLAEIDLPPSVYSKDGKPVYIKAERLNAMYSGGYKDKIYLTAIRTKQYNAEKSSSAGLVAAKNINGRIKNKFCRIGVKVKANENTQDAMDRFNVIAQMTARTWDGGWSTEKTPTSNSAAVALEVLTGLIHGPSKYEDSEIDLESFGELYEFCQNRKVKAGGAVRSFGLECNGALASSIRKIDLVKLILGTCEAGLYMDEFGKLSAYCDRAQETPIALLNPQRLVKLSVQKDLGLQPDYYDVEYVDQAADWAKTTHEIIRPRTPVKPGENTHSPLKLEFVTSYEQAMWLARKRMAKEILRPDKATAIVGKEGRFYKPGSLIKVQHERHKLGIGSGEIINPIVKDNMIIGLRLMESFYLSKDRDYFVDYYVVDELRNHVVNAKQIKSTGNCTNELMFAIPIPVGSLDAPEAGNILSVIDSIRPGTGVSVRESKRYLVADLSENSVGYELSLVQYHSDIYNEESEIYEIPEYKSSIIQGLPRDYNSVEDRLSVQEGRIPTPQQIAQQIPPVDVTTAPRYRGLFTVRPESNSTPVIGDIVANKGDYIMYNGVQEGIWQPSRMYQWDGKIWSQLSIEENRWKYLDGINDLTTGAIDGIFSNAFINTLIAKTAIIEKLFAETITINQDGSIQSENYVPGVSGSIIKAGGYVEFNDGLFRGTLDINNGIYRGELEAGPLSILKGPSTGKTLNYPVGTSGKTIFDNVRQAGTFNATGTYGDTNVGSIKITQEFSMRQQSIIIYTYNDTKVYINDSVLVAHHRAVGQTNINTHAFTSSESNPVVTAAVMNIQLTMPGKQLRLLDIPTTAPQEAGTVWKKYDPFSGEYYIMAK